MPSTLGGLVQRLEVEVISECIGIIDVLFAPCLSAKAEVYACVHRHRLREPQSPRCMGSVSAMGEPQANFVGGLLARLLWTELAILIVWSSVSPTSSEDWVFCSCQVPPTADPALRSLEESYRQWLSGRSRIAGSQDRPCWPIFGSCILGGGVGGGIISRPPWLHAAFPSASAAAVPSAGRVLRVCLRAPASFPVDLVNAHSVESSGLPLARLISQVRRRLVPLG